MNASLAGLFQLTIGRKASVTADLLRKYDRPGPRYTSYPTAVEFSETFGESAHRRKLAEAAARPTEPLSLYLHLPFCQERCAFCGCVVIITRKREVAARYLTYLHRELEMLADCLGERRRVVQYHWGGGTPTYLDLDQMQALHGAVTRAFEIAPGAEVAVEVDPRVTTPQQIDRLRTLGFNRLSMGIQDFTPVVQRAIDRNQGERETRELFAYARKAGFESINVDLVYGLPLQTRDTFSRTLRSVAQMRPDRVAVYSYAHVPWLRGNQKRIDSNDLPGPGLKFELFGRAIDIFLAGGYQQIGIDHFALPGDELAVAARKRMLHRNFMGYTTKRGTDLIGAGLSAIAHVRGAFAQNTKKLSEYYAALDAGRLPIERGYALDPDDRIRQYVITELMCNFFVDKRDVEERFRIPFDDYFARELLELASDPGPVLHGFLEIDRRFLRVLPRGRLFVRNICMTFDRYLARHAAGRVFSRTV